MKKIMIIILMVITNVFSLTAHAAWNFDEEIIQDKATQLLEYEGEIISHYVVNVPGLPVDGFHTTVTNGTGYRYENGTINTYDMPDITPQPVAKDYVSPAESSSSKIGEYYIEQDLGDRFVVYRYVNTKRYYGVVSHSGEVIVPVDKRIIEIDPFVDGYSRVMMGSDFYIVDKSLEPIIEISDKYEESQLVKGKNDEFLLIVKNRMGEDRLVDLGMNVIIDEKYDEIYSLNDGGIIASTGNTIYTFNDNYSEKESFSVEYLISHIYDNGTILLVSGDGYALMDKEFELKTDFVYSHINEDYVTITDGITQTQCYALVKDSEINLLDMNFEEYNIKDRVAYDASYTNPDKVQIVTIPIDSRRYAYALTDTQSMEYMIPYSFKAIAKTSTGLIEVDTLTGTKFLDSCGNLFFEVNTPCDDLSDRLFGVRMVTNKTDYRSGYDASFAVDAEGNNIFEDGHVKAIPLDYGKFLVLDYKENNVKLLTRNDVALHTDVKALINGQEIPCYSAEGRCVVVAEELRGYGFDVVWNGNERRLDITRNSEYYNINPLDIPQKGMPGSYYDKITTSDISVYFNGREINGYCINGRTLIQPESLKNEGISFNYDDSQRTLFIAVDGLEQK